MNHSTIQKSHQVIVHVTVHVTVYRTVHLSCNAICLLQYTSSSVFQHCIAIQYTFLCNTPHLPCNTPSFPLQYNLIHYTLKLQYNPCIAIQFFFSATAHSCNTILPYCNTLTQPTCNPHCNTISCIAIQFSSPTSLVAIQILVLQYNYLANKPPLAIQFSKPTTLPRLQYNFPIAIHLGSTALPQSLSHNTKLSITIQFGQWPKTVSALPFFFSLLFFFHINFQLLENTKKKLYTFFFSFSRILK